MAEKKEPWYVHGIVSLVTIGLTYVAFTDYESFIHPDRLGSGKSNKLFLIIFNGIDAVGGKWFVLTIMTGIAAYFLIQMIKDLKRR
jgi:hypothetical protein